MWTNASKCIETVTNYSCGFKIIKESLTETVVADDIHRNSKEDDDKEEDMNQINMSKYGYGEKDNMLKDGYNEKYGWDDVPLAGNLKRKIILYLWV